MKKKRRLSLSALSAVTGAVVLVGSEILAAAAAAAWAITGIFGLGAHGLYILAGLFLIPALYATFAFGRQALKAEPLYIEGV